MAVQDRASTFTGAVTVADGADVAQGTSTDAAGANTVVGQLKQISASALAGANAEGINASSLLVLRRLQVLQLLQIQPGAGFVPVEVPEFLGGI